MAKSVEQARENLDQAKAEMKSAKDLRDAQKVDAEYRAAKLKMNPKNMNYMRIKVTRTDKNDKADIVVGGNVGVYTIKPGKEVVVPSALMGSFNDAVEILYRQDVGPDNRPTLESYEQPRFNVQVLESGLDYEDYLKFMQTANK